MVAILIPVLLLSRGKSFAVRKGRSIAFLTCLVGHLQVLQATRRLRPGVEDYVIPVVKRSEEAAKGLDKPARLLWIDGAHDYEDVKKDFLLWEPRVLEGGIVALHDTTKWPGPKRVAKEYLYKSKKFKKVGFVGSVSFGQKVAENSLADRLRNRCMLLWKDIYTLARRGRPLKPIEELVKQAFPKRG